MNSHTQKRSKQLFTREELKLRNSRDDALIIIDDHVYDVTTLLAEHPGGEKVLLEVAGKDATQAFDIVNHSSDALSMMEEFKIGKLVKADRTSSTTLSDSMITFPEEQGTEWYFWLVSLLLSGTLLIVYKVLLE